MSDEPLKIIVVQGSKAPRATLCWQTPPIDGSKGNPMVHCDRKKGHAGPHSWECHVEPA